jgi:hypothetical protein
MVLVSWGSAVGMLCWRLADSLFEWLGSATVTNEDDGRQPADGRISIFCVSRKMCRRRRTSPTRCSAELGMFRWIRNVIHFLQKWLDLSSTIDNCGDRVAKRARSPIAMVMIDDGPLCHCCCISRPMFSLLPSSPSTGSSVLVRGKEQWEQRSVARTTAVRSISSKIGP